MPQEQWLSKFVSVYQALNKDNLDKLGLIYHQDILFRDPIHEVNGLGDLTEYFAHLYENVLSIDFDITDAFEQGDSAFLYWRMTFAHRKLKGGKNVVVEGHSRLTQVNGLVLSHRDYLDAGEMLYENIPLVGSVVRFIKKSASQ